MNYFLAQYLHGEQIEDSEPGRQKRKPKRGKSTPCRTGLQVGLKLAG